jgi:hypothetical protein
MTDTPTSMVRKLTILCLHVLSNQQGCVVAVCEDHNSAVLHNSKGGGASHSLELCRPVSRGRTHLQRTLFNDRACSVGAFRWRHAGAEYIHVVMIRSQSQADIRRPTVMFWHQSAPAEHAHIRRCRCATRAQCRGAREVICRRRKMLHQLDRIKACKAQALLHTCEQQRLQCIPSCLAVQQAPPMLSHVRHSDGVQVLQA